MTGTCTLLDVQKRKPELGRCDHKGEHSHVGNVCMEITQEHLKDLPTEEKYCPCKKQPDLIRTFRQLGYMEPEVYDSFVTKTCASCGKEVLVRLDEDICILCQLKPEFYEPVNREVYEETLAEIREQNKTTFSI